MKKFSNLYIVGFLFVLIIIVAALLSFVSEELKPIQERNVEIEKKQDILRSVSMAEGMDEAEDKAVFVESQFSKYISESFLINIKGEKVEGDAFEVTKALKFELKKPLDERTLPVFVCSPPSGDKMYILPVYGKGLWGPIWGYIALNSDFNTIAGTIFDHAKETPGLGAEINTNWFMDEFKGKEIFDNDSLVSIDVVKGGADKDNPHAVDAISGGTITSKALEEMLKDCLDPYEKYLKEQMK